MASEDGRNDGGAGTKRRPKRRVTTSSPPPDEPVRPKRRRRRRPRKRHPAEVPPEPQPAPVEAPRAPSEAIASEPPPSVRSEPPPRARVPIGNVPSRPPRPRRRRVAALLLAPIVLLAAGATLLPTFLLSRAESRLDGCLREILEQGEGDPQSCMPRSYEIAIARELPWLEAEARHLANDARYRVAVVRYGQATAITPAADARREAFTELLEAGRPLTEAATALGTLEGAFEEVTELAVESEDPTVRAFAFKSARAVARLDALKTLSEKIPADAPHVLQLWAGASKCLTGDAAGGRRTLLEADRIYRERAADPNAKPGDLEQLDHGYGPARLALAACGGDSPETRRVPLPYLPGLTALAASRMTLDGLDGARMLLENSDRQLLGEERLRIAAFVIADPKSDPLTAVEALALFAPKHGPAAAFDVDGVRTPFLLSGTTDPQPLVLVEPAIAERAAELVEKLAAENEGKQLECAGDECPVEVALTMPDRVLREGARMLWLEAAVEHARRGQRKPALAALQKSAALTPARRRHEAAPVHLAVDDAKGALDAVQESLGEKLAPLVRSRALVNQALALAHLGRFDKAFAAAENGFMAALSRERGNDDEATLETIAEQDRIAAAWIWAAMALRANKGTEVVNLLRDAGSERFAALAMWVDLAKLSEAERRSKRWNLSMREPVDATLPAAMYVVSRVAEGEVEVWIDRVFHEHHRHQPLRSMLARAEAARWRGDAAAEKRWLERAARLKKLCRDYPTSLLAQMVELR